MANRLFKLRVQSGKSRYRVAKDTGIAYSTLTDLETGHVVRVNLGHMQKLAKYYGVELNVKELLR